MPLDPRSRLVAPKYNPPRTWTPKGTVGMAAPHLHLSRRTPGGYQIFARTPMPIWDREQRLAAFKEHPALFRAGDRVSFVPIDREELGRDRRRGRRTAATAPHRRLPEFLDRASTGNGLAELDKSDGSRRRAMFEVIKPGLETSIQDLPGRIGFWDQGFPPSGPMDSWSFRLANLLVGNDRDAAASKCQYMGPTLRFSATA